MNIFFSPKWGLFFLIIVWFCWGFFNCGVCFLVGLGRILFLHHRAPDQGGCSYSSNKMSNLCYAFQMTVTPDNSASPCRSTALHPLAVQYYRTLRVLWALSSVLFMKVTCAVFLSSFDIVGPTNLGSRSVGR